MDVPSLPSTAFIDPTGQNHQAIEALFQQITAHALDYLTSAAHHTPLPDTSDLPSVEIETFEGGKLPGGVIKKNF